MISKSTYLIFLIGILRRFAETIQPPSAITAYDCSLPSVTKSYSIMDHSDCEQMKQYQSKINNDLHNIGQIQMFVLQKRNFIFVKLRTCTLYSKASLDYCGYSAIHHLIDENRWMPRKLAYHECVTLWEKRPIAIDYNAIFPKPYGVQELDFQIGAGKVTDGTCGGDNYEGSVTYNKETYSNAI